MNRETALTTDGCETGGILLGTADAKFAYVRHAGGPGPKADRTRTTFLRDRRYAEVFSRACWSLDRSMWIGEWHSHPGAPPVPSPTDLHTYAALLADDGLDFKYFVSIIVVPTDHGVVLAGWSCDQSGAYEAPIHFGVKENDG